MKRILLLCPLVIILAVSCTSLALKSKSNHMDEMTDDELVEFYYELNDHIASLERDTDMVYHTPHQVAFTPGQATGQAMGTGAAAGYYHGQINNLTEVRRNVLMEMRKRGVTP